MTSSVMKEAEAIKDEAGVICSICREGYHNQPNKVCMYVYSQEVIYVANEYPTFLRIMSIVSQKLRISCNYLEQKTYLSFLVRKCKF